MSATTTKVCKTCNVAKPETDFAKGRAVCKPCVAEKAKQTKALKAAGKTDDSKRKEESVKLLAEFTKLMEELHLSDKTPNPKEKVLDFFSSLQDYLDYCLPESTTPTKA